MSGNIIAESRSEWDTDGYIKKAYSDPNIISYVGKDNKMEVSKNCFQHYTLIDQEDIGNPDIDLVCHLPQCRKRQGK